MGDPQKDEDFFQKVADESYVTFMKHLYYFNVLNRKQVVEFY